MYEVGRAVCKQEHTVDQIVPVEWVREEKDGSANCEEMWDNVEWGSKQKALGTHR